MVADRTGNTITLVEVSVTPADPDQPQPIRAATLRQIPLVTITEQVKRIFQSDPARRVSAAVGETRKPIRRGRSLPDEHFVQVAWHYERARLQGEHPREAVSREWQVSLITATRWIAKARDIGVLEPYERTGSSPAPVTDTGTAYHAATTSVTESIVANELRQALTQPNPANAVHNLIRYHVLGAHAAAQRLRVDLIEVLHQELLGTQGELHAD